MECDNQWDKRHDVNFKVTEKHQNIHKMSFPAILMTLICELICTHGGEFLLEFPVGFFSIYEFEIRR